MFITFEGLDGSGKTTQARLLRQRLEAEGREVVATREPGGTPLGERVRELLLHSEHVAPWAEAALFAAARAQHVEELIRPALERGAVVLCDRYVDSSLAYQGLARGLGLERVLALNDAATGGLAPDLTFLLRIRPATAAGRVGARRDRIEQGGEGFWAQVDEAYATLADRFASRFVVLDGARPPDALAEEIHGAVRSRS